MIKNVTQLLRKILIFKLLIILCGCSGYQYHYIKDVSQYDFQNGDILFQHIPNYLCSVIADVTDSPYSHCGMVVLKQGRPYVLEAIGPVKYTPIKTWINRGYHGKFTQLRPKYLSSSDIMKAIQEAEKFLGRPYDIQYDLDEEKIYCSELIYKGFLRGCNTEIGEKEPLGDMNWKPHEDFIRYIAGGELPLNRLMVTPESVAQSPELKLIYSTFPSPAGELEYGMEVLTGTWMGEYTIHGLNKAIATLYFSSDGKFNSGMIKLDSGIQIKILNIAVPHFNHTQSFSAKLIDSRGIHATLQVHIRDQGNKLIGTWQDNLGFRGLFSLGRVS